MNRDVLDNGRCPGTAGQFLRPDRVAKPPLGRWAMRSPGTAGRCVKLRSIVALACKRCGTERCVRDSPSEGHRPRGRARD